MEINVSKLKEFGSTYRVLYVEDDDVIRTQTVNFLSRFFNNIDIAEDGEIGLKMYKNSSYDIVITDINMPNMNGIEMIEHIKDIDENQIILVTSAYNDSENLLKLINLHIMWFVLKPFDFKKFLVVLYNIIEKLHTNTQIIKMQEQLNYTQEVAQSIVDHVDIGFVVIEKNVVKMANEAFLHIHGFDDFATMQLEMPEIGVLYQNYTDGICVQTNAELIEELIKRPMEERRVRLLLGEEEHEYQINLSVVNAEHQTYVLSYTDISELHNHLTQDIHTKLPHRQEVLSKIESISTYNNFIYCYIISLDNYNRVLKWYGKSTAIETEIELAQQLKLISKRLSEAVFLGHFNTNEFVILTSYDHDKLVEEQISSLKFEHNRKIKENHAVGDKSFALHAKTKRLTLNLNNSRDEVEVFMMNAFDGLIN